MPTSRPLVRRLAGPAAAALTTVVVAAALLPSCSHHASRATGRPDPVPQQAAAGQPGRVLHPAPAPGAQVGGESGNVYAGTDKTGRVYRISPQGKGFVLHQTPQTEVRTLLLDGDVLYAGTAGTKQRASSSAESVRNVPMGAAL